MYKASKIAENSVRRENITNYGIHKGLEFSRVLQKDDLLGFVFHNDTEEAVLFFNIAKESDPNFDSISSGDVRRITDLLQIFLPAEDFDMFGEDSYEDYMRAAADALSEYAGSKKVNIKLLPNKSNTKAVFPLYGKYIEEYKEDGSTELMFTDYENKKIEEAKSYGISGSSKDLSSL